MADSRLNIKITTDTAQAKRELSGFQRSFTEFNAKVDAAKFALETFTGVFKKAIDIGEEAAQLELAQTQFDNLATSIGSTSDAILTRLSAATSGMMSNAEMIASASQIISLGLADNEDDVIRLADVVGRLGLDMQQVILTFANNSEMRLDALGLSVDTVREKAKLLEEQGLDANKAFDTAVLEALEERVALLGDTAETSAGTFKQLRATLENQANTIKMALLPVLEDAARGYLNIADGVKAVDGALLDQTQRAIDSRLTWEEYLDTLGPWAVLVEAANLQRQGAIELAYEEKIAFEQAMDAHIAYTETLEAGERQAEKFSGAVKVAADDVEAASEDIAAAAEDVYTFSDALDDAAKGRPSAVAGLIEDIKWLQAGGADIGQLMDDIEKALEDGLDPAAVGDTLATALVASLLASMQAGQTDMEGASQTLQDTLGIDAAEAEAMLSEFESAADAVAAAERELQYQIVLDEQSQTILNSLMAVLGVDSHTVNVSLVGQTRGGSQSFSGTSSGWDPEGPGGHSGMNFVVPPGFPNDSFPMRVESGEHVQVTPANQVGLGSGGGSGAPVIVLLDGEQIAARVLSSAGSQYRQTRANGGAYVGR